MFNDYDILNSHLTPARRVSPSLTTQGAIRAHNDLVRVRGCWARYAVKLDWARAYRSCMYGGGKWIIGRNRYDVALRMLNGLAYVPQPANVNTIPAYIRVILRGRSIHEAAKYYGVSANTIRAAVRVIRTALARHVTTGVPVFCSFNITACYNARG